MRQNNSNLEKLADSAIYWEFMGIRHRRMTNTEEKAEVVAKNSKTARNQFTCSEFLHFGPLLYFLAAFLDYSKFVFLESAEKLMAQLHTVLHYEFESQPDTVLNNNVLTCENPNKEKYQKI